MQNYLLADSLQAAVPMYIARFKACGGITQADIEKAELFGAIIAEKGDIILYRSEKKGESAELFNKLAFTVAVMSFFPGGVKVFGKHYQATE